MDLPYPIKSIKAEQKEVQQAANAARLATWLSIAALVLAIADIGLRLAGK